MVNDPYREFRQAIERPDERIDLGRAALTIALADYPDLDIASYLKRIDDLAVQVSQRSGPEADIFRSIAALNYVLFKEQGFRGNRDEYYDPKNSFLNEVLDRKRGLPITLSILYMEVGQRNGLAVEGVGFPGHFLVKTISEGQEIVIDPFNAGDVKSYEALQAMLDQFHGGRVRLHRDFLAALPKKQILKRMLTNLKAIYGRGGELVKLLAVLDRLIILDPCSVEDVRDRGSVYLRLDCHGQAKDDFETYLRLAPDAKDAAAIREQLVELAKHTVLIH
ncbi:MAG TPA: tetratricopeptide repeat protein [Candidatus Binatia bacterium]|nr:tetratricopeptide repeat protein [Candidatus Binatia bacterium]